MAYVTGSRGLEEVEAEEDCFSRASKNNLRFFCWSEVELKAFGELARFSSLLPLAEKFYYSMLSPSRNQKSTASHRDLIGTQLSARFL